MPRFRNLVDQALGYFDFTNQGSAPATPSVGPRVYGNNGLLWFMDTDGETYLCGDIERLDILVAGSLAVGTGKVRYGIASNYRIESIFSVLGTPGTSATTIDINYSSTAVGTMTTIFTTQSNRPTFSSGVAGNFKAGTVPDVRDLSQLGVMTVDIDTAGTGAKDLVVSIRLRRTS